MMLCKDMYALLHVISLVDWAKHVHFSFFFCVPMHDVDVQGQANCKTNVVETKQNIISH